jgi:NADPH2:quinone reductase
MYIAPDEITGPQLEKLGLSPNFAFICHEPTKTIGQLIPVMNAWGKIGTILPVTEPLAWGPPAFSKALSLHYELMFAKGLAGYDLDTQGRILTEVSKLIDQGTFKSIETRREVLSVKSLRAMHKQSESGTTIGKIVFTIPETLE